MKIALTGDVMLGRLVNDCLMHKPPSYPWGNTLPLIREADFALVNLECALTSSPKMWTRTPKVFFFKADPNAGVRVLKAAGINCVNLANNHVLDYEEEGLRETLETLERAGIAWCGAGRDLREASRPAIVSAAGLRVAVIGATDNEPIWLAGTQQPGVNYMEFNRDNVTLLQPAINEARGQADLVILSLHWGPNMRQRPTREFVEFAYGALDSGIDVIHGHSAHIFQGVEVRNGKPIIYDAGDFIDDYAVDPFLRNDRGLLIRLEVEGRAPNAVGVYPTLISEFQANLAEEPDYGEIVSRMRMLSGEMGTELTEESGRLTAVIRQPISS